MYFMREKIMGHGKMIEAVAKNYRLCNNKPRVGKFEKC